MKWLFVLLVLVNLGLYGFSKLDAPPVNINITQREVNASQVRVVTGQLGKTPEPTESDAKSIASATTTEVPSPTATPKPTTTALAAVQPTPQVNVGRCWRWAGVTGEQIENARSKIKSLGLSASETSSGESTKVWVYMPPLDSLDIAKQKAAQLAEMGVTDYFVVNNGGRWQNAISLGIFSTREAGERHLAELKALGVKSAVVRDRDDTLKQASFNFKNISDAQADKITKLATLFTGSVVRELKCK
ncbi:SPOR domain-containing protein [Deefgea tanakiae]|uniref:SPOR domain-containing protein n=1 Tax=Deefgea tanakiae TaxID=2865840 RepID=A0ABX8Z2D5_9NEIS|nr:SPOR domain-containing protein [Deefgea tanakiae]QZA76732.1 SPOR domain-containing protein [Deefgea tanakiae]